ncbi:phosphatase PAP2 family protein [Petropleomorpha daqingensis]|uniref:Undecaprenyl-diphosphatase n=1 Tax=Petropleomorpha daqingensis TaxID=2026353 RepID=A0A853CJV9_9ACTN|nr:phosphatase PAP2 family protein [Petropleomorpha daqingensis]NYJ08215.1 undecaprenyl-diphosphatase [Petropleomorpha daqingensis]
MAAEDTDGPIRAAEERLADRLAAQQARSMPTVRARAIAALSEFGAIDRAVYRAVAETPTPTLDPGMRRLSTAADRSKLWLGAAGVLAAVGGRQGRRAAASGVMALAVDSAVVNLGFKQAARRSRPDPVSAHVPADRQVRMPHSASFPSGHAASAFAFANAVGQTLPTVAAPLRLLACAVGYSRVHTGVHYPGDVVIGAVIGASVGELVGWGAARLRASRFVSS